MKIQAIVVCALFGLTGCAGNLAELKKLNPSAADFSSSLAREYLAYADSEAEQGRADAAEHFAEKGLKASRGESVVPDMPPDSMMVDSKVKLSHAREILMAVLTDDVKSANPQSAARAQLLYDCWLAQQVRKTPGELTPCADEFRSSLDEVQKIADLFVLGNEAVHELQFAAGSAEISPASQKIISQIARHMKRATNYAIELEAFSAGNGDDENSGKRIAAVKLALVKAGISEAAIKEKDAFSPKAVMLGEDVVKADIVEITVRAYSVPGGR